MKWVWLELNLNDCGWRICDPYINIKKKNWKRR